MPADVFVAGDSQAGKPALELVTAWGLPRPRAPDRRAMPRCSRILLTTVVDSTAVTGGDGSSRSKPSNADSQKARGSWTCLAPSDAGPLYGTRVLRLRHQTVRAIHQVGRTVERRDGRIAHLFARPAWPSREDLIRCRGRHTRVMHHDGTVRIQCRTGSCAGDCAAVGVEPRRTASWLPARRAGTRDDASCQQQLQPLRDRGEAR